MDVLSATEPAVRYIYERVTDEERGRIGRKLRALRIEQGWDQRQAAIRAALSVGTVQAIEVNRHRVHDGNIEKYAAVFGATITQLLRNEEPVRDPILIGLNREHLAIAHQYMRALKVQRETVELLLKGDTPEELVHNVLLYANSPLALTDNLRVILHHLFENHALADVIREVILRLVRDPGWEAILREQLRVMDRHPTPPTGSKSL